MAGLKSAKEFLEEKNIHYREYPDQGILEAVVDLPYLTDFGLPVGVTRLTKIMQGLGYSDPNAVDQPDSKAHQMLYQTAHGKGGDPGLNPNDLTQQLPLQTFWLDEPNSEPNSTPAMEISIDGQTYVVPEGSQLERYKLDTEPEAAEVASPFTVTDGYHRLGALGLIAAGVRPMGVKVQVLEGEEKDAIKSAVAA